MDDFTERCDKLLDAEIDRLDRMADLVKELFPAAPDQPITTTTQPEEAIAEIIAKIQHLPDIKIEVCGTWLWVSGNTKPVKDQLKEAGLHFAHKKVKWYFAATRSAGRGNWDMNHIREVHGSQIIRNNE